MARLVEAADRARATTDRWLGEHFAVDGQLSDRIDYHHAVVRKFRRRGDHDRVAEELARLERFYRGLGRDSYVREAMPRNPIQNRLFDWLRDGSRESLFALRYPAGGLATYAYGGPRRDALPKPIAGRQRRYVERVFAPLRVPAATDHLYVVAYALRTLDEDDEDDEDDERFATVPRDPARRPSQPVLIERFPDAATAGRALDGLLAADGPLTAERRYSLGRDDWRRVYWQYDGDVTYAIVLQAGEFLLATAPSETAWEERVDWRTPLERTFLHREPRSST
jgi:hypothetical protein